MESRQVVPVEGCLLQPLDGADEEQLLGNGSAVRSYDIDLDVVGTGPVAAQGGGSGQPAIGQSPSLAKVCGAPGGIIVRGWVPRVVRVISMLVSMLISGLIAGLLKWAGRADAAKTAGRDLSPGSGDRGRSG